MRLDEKHKESETFEKFSKIFQKTSLENSKNILFKNMLRNPLKSMRYFFASLDEKLKQLGKI